MIVQLTCTCSLLDKSTVFTRHISEEYCSLFETVDSSLNKKKNPCFHVWIISSIQQSKQSIQFSIQHLGKDSEALVSYLYLMINQADFYHRVKCDMVVQLWCWDFGWKDLLYSCLCYRSAAMTHPSKPWWSRWAGGSGVSRGARLTISSARSRISLGKKSKGYFLRIIVIVLHRDAAQHFPQVRHRCMKLFSQIIICQIGLLSHVCCMMIRFRCFYARVVSL